MLKLNFQPSDKVIREIIRKLFRAGENRVDIINLLDAEFLRYAIEFFNKVAEVKLMGKGNPESEDSVYPRLSQIFVADKLSQQNKNQLNCANIFWIELSAPNGYRKFGEILAYLSIPCVKPPADIENLLKKARGEVFD